MKTLFLASVLLLAANSAHAQYGYGSNSNSHSRSGYVTRNGTYVPPSRATNPNTTQSDNYGTRGNYNPYTGNYGTRTPRY